MIEVPKWICTIIGIVLTIIGAIFNWCCIRINKIIDEMEWEEEENNETN